MHYFRQRPGVRKVAKCGRARSPSSQWSVESGHRATPRTRCSVIVKALDKPVTIYIIEAILLQNLPWAPSACTVSLFLGPSL